MPGHAGTLDALGVSAFTRGTIHGSSCVSPDASLGADVTVGPFAVIHAGVELGEGSFVGAGAVLGEPTADFYHNPSYEPQPCRIGPRAVLRSHSIVYAGSTIGDDFACGHHVTIREGSTIGDDVRIGTNSDVQGDLAIGAHTRLHSGVFVAQRSVIEDFVWIFPHAVLTNDPHPPSDTCTRGPTIRRFAVVAANATIMPAVEVGEGALVGAKSLVRSDVPPATVVVGIPAQVVGQTSDVTCCAGRLDQVYPWWTHFRRGYPEGVLPPVAATGSDAGDDEPRPEEAQR